MIKSIYPNKKYVKVIYWLWIFLRKTNCKFYRKLNKRIIFQPRSKVSWKQRGLIYVSYNYESCKQESVLHEFKIRYVEIRCSAYIEYFKSYHSMFPEVCFK